MALTNNNELNIAGNKAKMSKAVEQICTMELLHIPIKGYDIAFILLSFHVFPLFKICYRPSPSVQF